MNLLNTLLERAHSKCELCSRSENVSIYETLPLKKSDEENCLILCDLCQKEIMEIGKTDAVHWQCLKDSMWSEYRPVQVMAYRILWQLQNQSWAQELLEQLYLEDSVLEHAKTNLSATVSSQEADAPTLDSNGTKLAEGDSVTLIKDLEVKGGGFTAKRGTLVKNISLTSNTKHVEGKVNGIQIVLVSAYLKKV